MCYLPRKSFRRLENYFAQQDGAAPIADGSGKTILGDFSIPSTNHPALKDVRGVVGSRWKQRYLVEVNGEEVVFNGQWSVAEKKWQPYTARSDWWWESHQDWKKRSNFKLCAGCHSTGLDPQTQKWQELNISCESCHGAGRQYSGTSRIEDIVNPARLARARSMIRTSGRKLARPRMTSGRPSAPPSRSPPRRRQILFQTLPSGPFVRRS